METTTGLTFLVRAISRQMESEATAEAFGVGSFHMGDLARIDEEGFVTIMARKTDMIISGAENIYPKEIEDVLYLHPAVLEAAVFGIPDDTWGESAGSSDRRERP